MKKFLIIQTAFIGDVILATAVVEKLHGFYPESKIDFLVRKGNESLLDNHPIINKVIVWDKKNKKYSNLFKIIKGVRKANYTHVINLHRFMASGVVTALSKAKFKSGFKKNPLSVFYTEKHLHKINNGLHEVDRNQKLIASLTNLNSVKPKLYPTKKSNETIELLQLNDSYIVIAPASVWFTKQIPKHKVIELIKKQTLQICLIGAPNDKDYCQSIINESKAKNIVNLAGKLSLLDSALLIKNAKMSYVNDSAPLHLASAMNANVIAFFCSTIPDFGFGPLSDDFKIIQINKNLKCRPCGLHGFKQCPKNNFECGNNIIV